MFRETFRSQVTLNRPEHVQVRSRNAPFRSRNTQWPFLPHPQGTEVRFFVDFEFRSRLLQAVIGTVFEQAVRVMVRAFERRATPLYGRNTAPAGAPPAPAPPTA